MLPIKSALYSWRIYCISEIHFALELDDLHNLLFSNFVKDPAISSVQWTNDEQWSM